MKVTYSAAISQDGFIAREDGDVSWLDEVEINPDHTDLEQFFASVDGLIMGRATYDFVFNYGSWPYGGKPTWIFTHRSLELMEGARLTVTDSIEDVITGASRRNLKHLWLVGGGKLASAMLDAGMITHLSITEMPIRLDRGIPLFSDHRLEDLAVKEREVIQKDGFRQIEIAL